MKGEIVSGVRIRPIQPKVKDKPIFTEDKIPATKLKGVTVEQIQSIYQITNELIIKYNEYTT